LYRQLISRQLLAVDLEGHGGLHLAEQCRPILRGEQSLMLRKFNRKKSAEKRQRKTYDFAKYADQELWEALRRCRQQLADEQGVPAYVIFHDATLMEMLENRPETTEQLGRISGIGEKKLEAYAEDFLAVLAKHAQASAPAVDSAEETLQLFRLGMDVDRISQMRDIKTATIYSHLAKAISEGEALLQDVVSLEESEIEEIRFALEHSDDGRLQPVHEALDGEYSYEIIRCVKASLALSCG
jgi:ATP-dependent DNA helicase RecQ